MSQETSASHTLFLVNPASRGGATGKMFTQVAEQLKPLLGGVEPIFTERAGHATKLTRQALRSGVKLVVVMGGDGTLNEVVNGFFDGDKAIAPDAAIGLLPAGTGGDFRKTTGAPRETLAAAQQLAEGARRLIDVGRLTFIAHDGRKTVRYFINITSFGIGGLVDRYVNQSSKALGGRISFFLASMKATWRYRNAHCRLLIDDAAPEEGRFYSVAVANGRYFGGGMMMAPEALLDDGQFDVVTIGDIRKATLLRLFSRVYQGTHLDTPKVSLRRARKIVAEPVNPEDEVLLDVDGEAPGRLPATFELLPQAIYLQG